MFIASVSEAKNKLSALLDRVRAGESILIVDRGRPVARLEPAVSGAEPAGARANRLERAGIIRRGSGETGKLPPLVKPHGKSNVVDVLLAERRVSR